MMLSDIQDMKCGLPIASQLKWQDDGRLPLPTLDNPLNIMPLLQFTPHSSLVQPGFWHELTRIKIDVLKLSEQSVPIVGSYSPGRWIVDRESGNQIALNGSLSLSETSFDLSAK